jgi:phosphatidylglycerophosphatase A
LAAPDRAPRASWRFVLSHPAHCIAFGFGAGLAPLGPGTFGTALALPLYWGASAVLGAAALLAAAVALFALGVWACTLAGRALGARDHPGMVWDETVAFLFVLQLAPPGAGWLASAFVLFRAFDILKPFPIRALERRLPGGWGVMADDLAAAAYTLIVLALAKAAIG